MACGDRLPAINLSFSLIVKVVPLKLCPEPRLLGAHRWRISTRAGARNTVLQLFRSSGAHGAAHTESVLYWVMAGFLSGIRELQLSGGPWSRVEEFDFALDRELSANDKRAFMRVTAASARVTAAKATV